MQSGEGAVPAKESATQEPQASERDDTELTPEEVQHILEKHVSIEIKDRTLLVKVVDSCCDSGDPCDCPPPKGVSIFYCRKPPCP
jgi:hypothetical protein